MNASEQWKRNVKRVYVGLGSNIGDREGWLMQAVEELRRTDGVTGMRLSAIYETAPVGYTDQGPFLNMAASLEVDVPVMDLFRRMMFIEQRLGRKRTIHWGPRTIDLDLLMVDNLEVRIEEPDLIVPHPRMLERAFVLTPLLDVLTREHPDYDKLLQRLQSLPDQEGVNLWRKVQSQDESGHSAN
jgi:2-amino-4-hydroxy-6-hydroxymethyldihydropteridine diphosphokinase